MIGSPDPGRAGENPFVGPRPLETGRRLFGRDHETAHLYDLLSAERIVLLHSPSGAGKSSLIHAALIPRLSERFDVWGPTRVNLASPAEVGGVNRFAWSAMLGFEQAIPASRRRGEADLAAMSLAGYARTRPRRRSAPPGVALIFDQFEEILTIDPLALEAKREFFVQLSDVLEDPRYWALFAIREEFLARFDPYAPLLPTHLRNRLRLDLLDCGAAQEAIARTSALGGRLFTPAALDKLVTDLATVKVQRSDGTFGEQAGQHVEPLQLQVVCRGLWERMPAEDVSVDPEDVAAYGDVTNALSGYYAGEVARIAGGNRAVERTIRDWIGAKLITPSGIRDQVLRGSESSEGLANDLVARLVDTHLVRGEQRGGAVWYELAHDRLIRPVLADNARWEEANLNPVQKAAALWEAQGRPAGLLLSGEGLKEGVAWVGSAEGANERRFVEESVKAEEAAQRERRQAKRLRRFAVAAVLLGIFGLSAGALAALMTLMAVEADERSVRTHFDAAWIAADYIGRQDVAVSPDSFVFGARTLYNKMKSFLSLKTMESLSPHAVFQAGSPHTDGYNFRSYEFGRYNSDFVEWAAYNVIPDEPDQGFLTIGQRVYDKYLKNLSRMYYLSYLYLEGHPKLAGTARDDYVADLKEFRGKPYDQTRVSGPGLRLQDHFKDFAAQYYKKDDETDYFIAMTAPGFWVRRRVDGSEEHWLRLLLRLLETFDRDWLNSRQSK